MSEFVILLACGHTIEIEKSTEVYPIAPEDDWPEYERQMWSIDVCPKEDECSFQSWKKHQPWSMIDETKCWNYLAHHLKCSGKHNMSDADLWQFFMDNEANIKIRTFMDTWSDRQVYRNGIKGNLVVPLAKRQKLCGSCDSSAASGDRNAVITTTTHVDERALATNKPAPTLNMMDHNFNAALGQALMVAGLLDPRSGTLPSSEEVAITMCQDKKKINKMVSGTVTVPREAALGWLESVKRAETAVTEAFCGSISWGSKLKAEKDRYSDGCQDQTRLLFEALSYLLMLPANSGF